MAPQGGRRRQRFFPPLGGGYDDPYLEIGQRPFPPRELVTGPAPAPNAAVGLGRLDLDVESQEAAPCTPTMNNISNAHGRPSWSSAGSAAPAKKKIKCRSEEDRKLPHSPILRPEFKDQKRRHREYKFGRRGKLNCALAQEGTADCSVCRLSDSLDAIASVGQPPSARSLLPHQRSKEKNKDKQRMSSVMEAIYSDG